MVKALITFYLDQVEVTEEEDEAIRDQCIKLLILSSWKYYNNIKKI